MKAFAFAALLLALRGAADATLAAKGGAGLSPVTRVVELLQDLSKTIETENKAEEDLYETFVCWAKSMISQKEAANTASQSRIDMLETYISDLDSGRIEFTTERQDLEKEIKTLKDDTEAATANREKEHKDFEGAEEEMDAAVEALEKALEVLRVATEDHKVGVLINLRGMMSEGATERSRQAAQLSHAVDLVGKVLKKGDALFLRRILTGEVPTPDWKKLNRKATFKKSYKARSFKIQGVLAKLLEEFTMNLHDATGAEAKAQTLYDTLMTSKTKELTSASQALRDMKKENGAKGMSKEESVEEKGKLTEEVANDVKYIGQVKSALADKKVEWQARQVLRTGELGAISQAIQILHNDDSRDLFKKSFASQDKGAGFFFLQEATTTEQAVRRAAAVQVLRAAVRTTEDARLAQLAARMQTGGQLDKVVIAIDKMVVLLKDEEAKDLKTKETCEEDRAGNTRTAAAAARAIDEMSDAVATLEKEIENLKKEIEEKEAAVAEIEEELKKIATMRGRENADFLVAKQEDEDAAAVVLSAKAVLEKFYADNGLNLLQQVKKQPFTSVAGEAPPPPPPTWDASYAGKKGEQQGIVTVLEMIHEDIVNDAKKAASEEAKSLAMYVASKAAMDKEVISLNGQITDAESTQSDKELEVTDLEGSRSSKKGELVGVMKTMDGLAGGCEFFTINYLLRAKNRQVEIDGLTKAKAILSGASFAPKEDPNREIKPGDALVQKQKTNLRQVRSH